MLEGDTFALDKILLLKLRDRSNLAVPVGPHWVQLAMTSITNLGSGTTLTLITLFAVGVLFAARKPKMAIFIATSITLGVLLSGQLKTFFSRPRPVIVPHLVPVSCWSFPSGHSMNSAIVYLTLATLVARTQRSKAVQVFLLGSAVVLAILIGISRIYVGVHWPSDVLFGLSVGAAWAALSSLGAKRIRWRLTH